MNSAASSQRSIDQRRFQLHPATALLALLCGLVLVYGINSPVVPVLLLILICTACWFSPRVSMRRWLGTTAVLAAPMMLMSLLIQGLFYPGDDARTLLELGFATVTVEGIAVALGLGLRILALVSMVVFFSLGSDPAAVFDGFITLRAPLSVAYICATTLTLGPLLIEHWRDLWRARQARGWNTDSFLIRIRLFPEVVTGLITTVLGQLDQRHQALTQRGFGTTSRPQPAREYTSGPQGDHQGLLRLTIIAATAGLVTLSAIGWLDLPQMSDLTGVLSSTSDAAGAALVLR